MMSSRTFLRSLLLLPLLLGLVAPASSVAPSGEPELVFKTGFEGDTKVVPYRESDDEIVGKDSFQKSDIVADLGIKHFGIGYTHGDPSKRFARIIPEPGNPGNKVLWFWLNDSWKADGGIFKARVQADLYGVKEGDSTNGRFYMAITSQGQPRQVVYDVTGWTRNTTAPAPDGITDWNPMKLYTSKELVGFMKSQDKTLQIYWDDFELWKNRQPTDSKPTPAKP